MIMARTRIDTQKVCCSFADQQAASTLWRSAATNLAAVLVEDRRNQQSKTSSTVERAYTRGGLFYCPESKNKKGRKNTKEKNTKERAQRKKQEHTKTKSTRKNTQEETAHKKEHTRKHTEEERAQKKKEHRK